MTSEVITLDETDNLNLARMEMSLARIRHLPVLRGDKLVGLVTHRDILRSMCSVFAELDDPEQHDVLRNIPVREIMSEEVRTVSPSVSAAQAGRTLLESKLGCLPVVEDGERLVGIITEADFVDLAVQHIEEGQIESAVSEGEF
jgi:CBS domain-containing membrane protein